MPNVLGMGFDECVSRFSREPSIRDPEAFCGSLEKLVKEHTVEPAAKVFELKIPVVKIDRPKGLVTGWASIVTTADGTPIIDHDGEIIPIAELEKAAQEAFADGQIGRGKAGDMHERTGVADLVESMVLSAEKREELKLGKGPEGWVVTLKINDPKLLAEIVDGTKTELSILGTAERIPLAEAA